MELILIVSIILLAFVWWRLEHETKKRKEFETIVAMWRDKERLNEQQVVLFMEAQKYDWLDRRIKKA